MKLSCDPHNKTLTWFQKSLSISIGLSYKEALVLALAIEQAVEIELSVTDPDCEHDVLATIVVSGEQDSELVMVGFVEEKESVTWATGVDRNEIVTLLRTHT